MLKYSLYPNRQILILFESVLEKQGGEGGNESVKQQTIIKVVTIMRLKSVIWLRFNPRGTDGQTN